MRKWLVWMLMLALTMGLTGCAAGAEDGGAWMYAVSAGKADAILVGSGGAVCLIDTGHARSRGKILAAMERMGVKKLDAVFLTHTDDDHAGGLDWLANSDVEVGAWYASAMYIDVKPDKHPAVRAAAQRGDSVRWLQAGDRVALGNAVLEVLAPSRLDDDKDDNNSLVMMLDSPGGRILLAGDMEFPEEALLMDGGADLACDVLKVPNHADDDTCSAAFVGATSPKLAVICTDTKEKPETPDPRVMENLRANGAEIAVTQECTGGLLVRLNEGIPTVERIDLPRPQSKVIISRVIPGEDLIVLTNQGTEAEALGGCYLASERGDEWYLLPEGTVIQPGASLTIGTQSSDGAFELLWDDKKVVHRSKDDVIALYDASGMEISSMSNGF